MWLALAIIVGQGLIIGTLLYFVRTFGAYTEALLEAQRSNAAIHEFLAREIAALRALKVSPLTAVIAAAREVA